MNKSRKKRSADVVSFEDLLAAHKTERGPGQLPAEGVVLIGVDYELQRRMAERLNPSAEHPDSTLNFSGAPAFSALDLSAPKNSAPGEDFGLKADPTRDVDPLQNQAVESINPDTRHEETANCGAPTFDLRELLCRRTPTRTYTIHPVYRIEDALTSSERDLLRWLWEKGRPVPMTPQIRLVTGTGEGARRLAAQAGCIYNTFKNITRSLACKLAIDIVKPEKNLPAVYVVYHYSMILGRQRRAGLTGAIHKNGGGRELVDSQTKPAPQRQDLTVRELEELLDALNVGAPQFSAPNYVSAAPNFAALSGNFGAPKNAALIRNNKYTTGKESTTTNAAPQFGAPTLVIDALFTRTGRTDTEAARMIVKGCLEVNQSIQIEEIAKLIHATHIPTTIANPVGLLIKTLPTRCAHESISNYREQWRREETEQEQRLQQERAQTIETARGILEAVSKGEDWDRSTIEWAKRILHGEIAPPLADT